jgi:hypothetical protein
VLVPQERDGRSLGRAWARRTAAFGAALCLAACLVAVNGGYRGQVDLTQNGEGATREGDPVLDRTLDTWKVAMAGEEPCQETLHDMDAGVSAVRCQTSPLGSSTSQSLDPKYVFPKTWTLLTESLAKLGFKL